jgi:GNAT superfamily N-acetyltransferase
MSTHIAVVAEPDLPELLPLVRAYCDFYTTAPSDDDLVALSRSLLADPDCEGFQLIARDGEHGAVGFATVYWSWSTLSAARTAILNDLYVDPATRGTGLAEALIEACRRRARDRGAISVGWQTRKDNTRAQRVYDRIGAARDEWINYSLDAADPRSTR